MSPSSNTPIRMFGSGNPDDSQEEEHLRLQIADADLIRSRIAALERALATLQLDLSVDDPEDELSWLNLRVIDDGEDNDDSEDDLGGPHNTIRNLVMAGLAKKFPGGDNVTPGEA